MRAFALLPTGVAFVLTLLVVRFIVPTLQALLAFGS